MTGQQFITGPFLLFILLFLPGTALLAGGRHRTPARWSDVIFISLAVSGWLAQTLSHAGLLTIPLLCAVIIVFCLLTVFRRGRPAGIGFERPDARTLPAAILLLLIVALLYWPPVPRPLGPDPLPAINALGNQLARTGALPIAETSPGLDGAAGALIRTTRAGLFLPAWMALLQLAGGVGWAAVAPILFIGCSLWAAFRLGRLVTGRAWFGTLLLLALGLNYPQAWLAHTPVAASAAQFLVLSGALFLARSDQRPVLTWAAAFCLGSACFCRQELRLLLPLALLLLQALQTNGPATVRRRSALLGLGLLPFLVQAWLQDGAMPLPESLVAAGLFTTGWLTIAPHRGNRFPSMPGLVTWTLFAGLFAATLGLHRAEHQLLHGGSSHWIIWYLTFPLAVMMAGGLLTAVVRFRDALDLVIRYGLFLTLALVTIPFLGHNPGDGALQPWASRPFTVAVIPAAIFVALLFYRGVLRTLPSQLLKSAWAPSIALVLGLNLANQMPLATGRPGTGGAALVAQVVATLPEDGKPHVLVIEPGPGVLGLPAALLGSQGIPAFSMAGPAADPGPFTDLVRRSAATGRRTVLVVGEGRFAPDPAQVRLRPLGVVRVGLVLLPPAHDHLPSSVSNTDLALQLFEALPLGAGDPPVSPASPNGQPLVVEVGCYGKDWPYLASGFHGPARAAGNPYRWTGRRALLRLPAWTRTVELTLGGFRPPGALPATLSLRWDGQRDGRTLTLPVEGFTVVSLPCPREMSEKGESPVLELVSSCFRPGRWFTGNDLAPRGVQLAGIALYPGPASPLSPSEGSPPHPPSNPS